MTAPLDLDPSDEADALAAEYVLGVLTLQDRLAVEARMKSDAAFAGMVARWETHFEGLNDDYASLRAPDVLPLVEARLFGRQTAPKKSWWGFIVGAGAAAALAVAVLVVLPPADTGPVMTASLSGEAQVLRFDASYKNGELTLERTAGTAAEAGRDYELWVIVGDAAPVSLGLITEARSTLALADLPPGAVLAITLEPAGGAGTGAPTGPLLVAGPISLS